MSCASIGKLRRFNSSSDDLLSDDEFTLHSLLGVSISEAAKHIAYPTHFFSAYDLADRDEDSDVFDYIAEDRSGVSPEVTVYRQLQMECLRELFHKLPKKDRDILGKCFGAFGYPKTPLREIAMYHFIKEDAVEKARKKV